LGILAIATIVALAYGLISGEYLYLGFMAVIWLGLIVFHLAVGSAMALIVTLLAKLGQWRKRNDRDSTI